MLLAAIDDERSQGERPLLSSADIYMPWIGLYNDQSDTRLVSRDFLRLSQTMCPNFLA